MVGCVPGETTVFWGDTEVKFTDFLKEKHQKRQVPVGLVTTPHGITQRLGEVRREAGRVFLQLRLT